MIKTLTADNRYLKEVHRDQVPDVSFQENPPGLRWLSWLTNDVLPDGHFRRFRTQTHKCLIVTDSTLGFRGPKSVSGFDGAEQLTSFARRNFPRTA